METLQTTEQKQVKRKSWYAGKMWKVSVRNEHMQWIVKAACLTRANAKMISDELNSIGVTARFKPHSYGAREVS